MASYRTSWMDRFMDSFASYPWWVSIGFGGFMIVVLKLAAYSVAAGHPSFRPMANTLGSMWWAPAIAFTGTAVLSKILEKRHRESLARHASLQSLREVPWRQFESLVGAYFREQGFTVMENADPGPDGGCDLVLWKDGKRTLVQCKRLRNQKVSVNQVREFFGVVMASGAAHGIFVTTSEFTEDAMRFGLGQATLELIPGRRLVQLVQALNPSASEPADEGEEEPPPACPECQEPMVIRVSRRGPTPGSEFWGCSRYRVAGCSGMLPLTRNRKTMQVQ